MGKSGGVVTLDVREDLKAGNDPFEKIMAVVQTLDPSKQLVVIAIFEPVPLYGVMGSMGYEHTTERTPERDWRITFSKKADRV